jgi:hypothetical protein
MKPIWKDAPDWANFLVRDIDGSYWWYEYAPESNDWQDENHTAWNHVAGFVECAMEADEYTPTCEKRPIVLYK